MSRVEYRRRKSEFLDSGFLTIVCTLKTFDAVDEVQRPSKENEDSQLLLEKTVKEKDEIKKQLDAYKTENEKLLTEKSDLEAKLTALTDDLGRTIQCHHDKMVKDFKQLFLNREECDVVLRVKEREFQAHRAILSARSPVFASTFRNDMKEKETGIVDIEDCDPSVFPDFLCFLYSDEVENLAEKNVFSLFTAADKYEVTDLRSKCLEFMKMNISACTFCETLTVALIHAETELLHLSTDFFVENAEEILETVQWQTFAAENPTQSNELFIKYVKSVKH